MMNSKLFTSASIGPLTLRNRTIRSAAFESMCPGNAPSRQLKDYHCSVAAGGVGMTTIAYAAVTQSGLSFDRQLWMRPEIIPGLREITDAVHKEGAAVSIQLGHCGNMSHKSICGVTPVGASSGFNLYSPTFVRGLRKEELPQMAKAYGQSVNWAREAGFDAVEIHAGHGYLISQFLSPYTNHRKDEFGGSLENRMRFMDMVMEEVMRAAGSETVGTGRGSCVGAEWRFCKQSAYVCHAGSDAYKKYDTLYELLVAEIWGAYGRQMDDSDSTFQRGLFFGRCIEIQNRNKGNSVSICGGAGIS